MTKVEFKDVLFDYGDGEHDYIHALHESTQAFLSVARLIIWHDSDMNEVHRGIVDAGRDFNNYKLFRIIDTRIAYAIKE